MREFQLKHLFPASYLHSIQISDSDCANSFIKERLALANYKSVILNQLGIDSISSIRQASSPMLTSGALEGGKSNTHSIEAYLLHESLPKPRPYASL